MLRRSDVNVAKIPNHNPLTPLEPEDRQALYYSARQEAYNLIRFAEWEQYAKKWCCNKRLSDSPELKDAVLKHQKYVVFNQLRKYEKDHKLRNIPMAVQNVIILFYAVHAIYPVPNNIRYRPPFQGFSGGLQLSWKIHVNESMANWDHPNNKLDRERTNERWKKYEKTRNLADLDQKMKFGQFKRKQIWHEWHCCDGEIKY